MDIFKSVPQEGAVIRDLTGETITLDIVNSIGEKFHFEILPGEKDHLPTRASNGPRDKGNTTIVNMIMSL